MISDSPLRWDVSAFWWLFWFREGIAQVIAMRPEPGYVVSERGSGDGDGCCDVSIGDGAGAKEVKRVAMRFERMASHEAVAPCVLSSFRSGDEAIMEDDKVGISIFGPC